MATDETGFRLRPIVLTSSIKDEKFTREGKRVVQLGFKAHKGKVFVFAHLGTISPAEVTPKWVSKQLKILAKGKWEETKG